MRSLKTQLVLILFLSLVQIGFAQTLQLYFERADSTEITEMGYLIEEEGELIHKAIDPDRAKEELLSKLTKQIEETGNGNIVFYIHGMMAHTKWYQKMVQNKLNQGLFSKDENNMDIIVSLVWYGTMDYPQNYVDALSIGKSYFPLVDEIQALSKKLDSDRKISFIMHSMGSRTFQGIYNSYMLLEDPSWQAEDVLFVASDAPEDCFYTDGVFEHIDSFAQEIYVYKNVHDFTLGISRGLNKQDRIGLSGISDMTKVSEAISVIDVSVLNDNEGMMQLTGHRYFFESPTVRKDILRVLNSTKQGTPRDIVQDSILPRTYTLIK